MSENIYSRRLTQLKAVLSNQKLDGIYITNLTNVRYISGFTGSSGSCLITMDKEYFFTDGRYLTQSKNEVKGFRCVIGNDSHLKMMAKENLMSDGISIGFESDFVSVNLFESIKNSFPKVKWEKTSRIIETLAAVKDETELDALRTAVEITDQVYTEVLPMIKVGVTEKEIANELSFRYRAYGDGEAYSPIVATGPNSALPHAVSGDRPFAKGDFIVIDAAAKYAGYHADMTRTPVVGEATDRHREIYEIVREAQQKGLNGVKAGLACKEADALTRTHIEAAGYGEYYIHSTGHGLGLEIHTMPRLSAMSTDTLQENYVVTIEPGIYIPEFGGVRIEDDVIIQKDGCEVLNQTTKELVILK
ncbi:MAG: aminopeptidase P family protein [Candidatus Marinimicrobia bacterium]|jgi:Xaa-Pro aminopeptidase|nr:aminopeptidase P family protein [Candidatus Neomarinimicrobiota bacterium]MBT3497089.1 aminopeptidase P family protein [Candidatus Neomarinimicrobiota bacterium]MBT3691924.1 aminopeptidase P family protein [Candidatus Neomarinimicrobiota bacterium]MBT3732045.1 aminopeptidase P family protein [Candidatus Neomarinimicrobiota bacterium]MBT4144217.1 aminopeptidase P family protein [Candidatus Neomarinimicrobiota bacterium]